MAGHLALRKFVSPEIIFGVGSLKLVDKYVNQFSGAKVLLVSDNGVKKAGWLGKVENCLNEAKIDYHIYDRVTPNPRASEVMEGAEVYKRENCDIIVAVGGGSPMDCAKGIGIVVTNNINILECEGVNQIKLPVPPLIFIPTTAGTSADVSQFCIISDRDELVKFAIISKAIVPDVALIDPETTTTMDKHLTACTGIDALVHAIEAFVSKGNGVLTDSYALNAINLVNDYLPKLIADQNNIEFREKIMLASMKAGLAFSNASLGAVHAMAHSLGGFMDLPHGECNAMLLDHVINYNYDAAPERFKVIAENMGIDIRGLNSKLIKTKLFNRVRELKASVGIKNQLEEKGVKSSDIPSLSKKAFNDACLLTNPKNTTTKDLEFIFGEAM
jgi:alcohol dehydrogenase